ncbi:MAG: M48 family metallopeptidase [Chloroflexota bacterium]
MITETHQIRVRGLPVEIVRKEIKNLHLGVYPPNGRVRVAAPLAVSDDAVRLAVIGKLAWVQRQRRRFADQSRQSRREMVSGESHYVLGRRYRLRVVEHEGAGKVVLRNGTTLELQVRPGTSAPQREQVLQRWYRQHLRELIPPLLDAWQEAIGVQAAAWGIKKMKTKWGACNPESGRIWVNLELAKKPLRCTEYIVVHELVHIVERLHNDRFTALMDKYLADWRFRREELNSSPLGHVEWDY